MVAHLLILLGSGRALITCIFDFLLFGKGTSFQFIILFYFSYK